tara:strand:+ start:2281 stop:2472 length:192 start_codon:yes stop_codon:yes gene_type:complete
MTSKEPEFKSSNSKIAPPPSFVKLAMKNMVRKGSKSLFHLAITAFGFFGFVLLIASLGRPNMP